MRGQDWGAQELAPIFRQTMCETRCGTRITPEMKTDTAGEAAAVPSKMQPDMQQVRHKLSHQLRHQLRLLAVQEWCTSFRTDSHAYVRRRARKRIA